MISAFCYHAYQTLAPPVKGVPISFEMYDSMYRAQRDGALKVLPLIALYLFLSTLVLFSYLRKRPRLESESDVYT